MTARCISASIDGFTGSIVYVETDVIRGLPAMTITGLPDSTIRESRDRIRTAIENTGYEFPSKNFIINLAPAHKKKWGSGYDLAIAASILEATGQLALPANTACIGELALDGTLRPVTGIISMVIALINHGYTTILVPAKNAHEAAAAGEGQIFPMESLKDLFYFEQGTLEPYGLPEVTQEPVRAEYPDFKDILGQETALRAMEVAVAGMHNILLYGSPGSGKTMLARRVPGIMPKLSRSQALETTMIHSTAGMLPADQGLITTAPFRAPHHTSSYAAMAGGGSYPRAGEVSLAHNGVLFLDEFTEFSSHTLQTLRQPLEDATVTLCRSAGTVTYPSRFMLIGAANPCGCGNLLDETALCHCSPASLKTYAQKLNGPIMDRIDMEVAMNRVSWENLKDKRRGEPSAVIGNRVALARARQQQRFGTSSRCNGSMNQNEVERYCALDQEGDEIMGKAYENMKLTARAYHRILKVARTIADMEQHDTIGKEHILEALGYRGLAGQLFAKGVG